ncbi:THAP domain-containing protein 5 isoform X2 [Microcaecilia unicolor]|nr:THAP domain-containing protein 5-like isoform X2 [Microcaecilia unicolor]
MKREHWMPSKYQHLCSDHFTPSCFEWRWGVRYLKADAVPTVFTFLDSELQNIKDGTKTKPDTQNTKLINEKDISHVLIGPQPETVHTTSETSPPGSVALTIDPGLPSAPVYIQAKPPWLSDSDATRISSSIAGSVNLVPVMQIVEPLQDSSLFLATEPDSVAAAETARITDEPISDAAAEKQACFPVMLFHSTVVPGVAEAQDTIPAAVSFPCERNNIVERTGCTASLIPANLPVLTAVFKQGDVSEPGALVIENVSIEPFVDTDPAAVVSVPASPTQMVAYFETVPTATMVSSYHTASLTPSTMPPETVLSSALTVPIVSTLPIVSSHAAATTTTIPPEPLVVAAEESEMDSDKTLQDSLEEQPEDHRYNRNNMTTEQLLSVVMSLQKKVKVLQQRHRRHCSKLETMEGIVEQLRKENLVSEEKLKLLEMACLQSSTVVPDCGSTVAIICQEDAGALVCTVPKHLGESSETILHLEEESYSHLEMH